MCYTMFFQISSSHTRLTLLTKSLAFLQYWYQLSSKEERVKAEILLNKLHNGLQRL